MPGIAKERGIIALAGAVSERIPQAGSFAAGEAPSGMRARLNSATRTLDGIGGLGWAVIGFVVGAVFWHFIGFWSFMANVVLAGGPQTDVDRSVVTARPAAVFSIAKPAAVDASRCTTLVIARRSGVTLSMPCAAGLASFPDDRHQAREDRLAAATTASGR